MIAVEQPFGLRASAAMVRALGEASGRAREAERFIGEELRRLVPRFEWLVPDVLLGRRVAFFGEPTLFDGVLDGLGELGVRVEYLCAAARRPEHGVLLDERHHGHIPPLRFAVPRSTIARELAELAPGLDLVIGPSQLPALPPDTPGTPLELFEFGFPCFYRHTLFEAPFLGFRGWAWFVQELANALLRRR